MQEAFLHFIWQYQYFNKSGLATTDGSPVNIIYPGVYNTDAGPDFKEATIKIGEMEWRGHVEIHIKATDWTLHRHQEDKAYDNVILHVVWDNNQQVKRTDGTVIPAIELQGLVKEQVIFSYKKLLSSPDKIPCEKQLSSIKNITWISLLDRVLMERLSAKASFVTQLLHDNGNDWEEVTYQLLSKNFGFKINSEPFLILAKSLPYKVLKKHADNIHQIEALVFGQAGFLSEDALDDYQRSLQQEYAFLKHKYSLQQMLLPPQWKLLRLRPANFPTVRLSQFSQVLFQLPSLFQNLLSITSSKDIKVLLKNNPSEYWLKHYQFGKPVQKNVPALGESAMGNIIINTIAPLLVAYGQYIDDVQYIDRGIALLQQIKPEKNRITSYWEELDVKVDNAFDSQALIQLYNEYCNKHRCLSCNVGISLIRSN